jgi:hypothetical protein
VLGEIQAREHEPVPLAREALEQEPRAAADVEHPLAPPGLPPRHDATMDSTVKESLRDRVVINVAPDAEEKGHGAGVLRRYRHVPSIMGPRLSAEQREEVASSSARMCAASVRGFDAFS